MFHALFGLLVLYDVIGNLSLNVFLEPSARSIKLPSEVVIVDIARHCAGILDILEHPTHSIVILLVLIELVIKFSN